MSSQPRLALTLSRGSEAHGAGVSSRAPLQRSCYKTRGMNAFLISVCVTPKTSSVLGRAETRHGPDQLAPPWSRARDEWRSPGPPRLLPGPARILETHQMRSGDPPFSQPPRTTGTVCPHAPETAPLDEVCKPSSQGSSTRAVATPSRCGMHLPTDAVSGRGGDSISAGYS